MQAREVKKPLNLLLPFHPLTNLEINEYYKNEPRFNGVYSRNNLPNKIKKGIKTNEAIYFDSFGVEHIPKEINEFINSDMTKSSSLKRIKSNIFRIQAYDSIMCGYFCVKCINYMLKGKTLIDYTNLFSSNDFKKNDRIIKRIFKNE